MKKKSGFFFLMILVFALLLSACGASGAQDTATTAETAVPAADVAPDADAEAAQPETAAQQYAAAAGTEPAGAALGFTEREDSISGEYTDGSGNRYTYSYSLPLVSGDTDYAAAVNKELDGVYETYIAPELQHMGAGNSIITTFASWRAAEYKGVTSLLVYLHNNWDESAYQVYHFTADGEQVTNAQLLDTLGLSGEAFTAAASEKLFPDQGHSHAAADEGRNIVYSAVEPLKSGGLGQQHGDQKRENELQRNADNDVLNGDQQGIAELRILEKIEIVGQSDPFRGTADLVVTEGIIQGKPHGVERQTDKTDDEGGRK